MILIVDDDENMLHAVEAMVRKGGYSPLAVADPMEALRKSREFREDIHLLLTDMKMPGMDGITLARYVLAEHRHIRVLLMTAGRPERSSIPYVRKPFRMNELLERIAEVRCGPPQVYDDLFGDSQACL